MKSNQEIRQSIQEENLSEGYISWWNPKLYQNLRSYFTPYTIITNFLRYITTQSQPRPLMVENTKSEDELINNGQSIEDEEFQIILPTEDKKLDKVQFEPRSCMPIIYYDYIDEAIEKYKYDEMIIRRFPDYGFMSVYMMQMLSREKLDMLLIPLYIRKCEDRILIEYQGKQYEWYWFENNFVNGKNSTGFPQFNSNMIYGPDTDILNHFKEKPDYIHMDNS